MTSACLAQAVRHQYRPGGALEHDGCMQGLTTAPPLPHRYVDKSDLPEPELKKLKEEAEQMVSSEVSSKPKTEEEDYMA